MELFAIDFSSIDFILSGTLICLDGVTDLCINYADLAYLFFQLAMM